MTLGFNPGEDFLTPKALEVLKKAERKLTFIPMVFVLLRIWGTIRFFRFLYFHPEGPPAIDFLVFLQVGTCKRNYIHILCYESWFYGDEGDRLYFNYINHSHASLMRIFENLLFD